MMNTVMAANPELLLEFDDEPVEAELIDAMCEALPNLAPAASFSEHYLYGAVLDARFPSADSVRAAFKDMTNASDRVVRFDYETWSTPEKFDPGNPEQVIYRREHIYVADETVREAAASGVWPDVVHWHSDDESSGEMRKLKLPPDGQLELIDWISIEHTSTVEEFLDYDDIPAGLSQRTKQLYRKIAKTAAAKDALFEKAEKLKQHELETGSMQVDLGSLMVTYDQDKLVMYADSEGRAFRILISASLNEDRSSVQIAEIRKLRATGRVIPFIEAGRTKMVFEPRADLAEVECKLREWLVAGQFDWA